VLLCNDGLDLSSSKSTILLSQELPSERDDPESLRAKMAGASSASVPIPTTEGKFGAKPPVNNPFGPDESDEVHYWYVISRVNSK
jgi:hypothetical protein